MYIRGWYLAVLVGAAAVGDSERRGALLPVPGKLTRLRDRADGDGVDGADVAVAVAVIASGAAVSGRPNVDDAAASSPVAGASLQRLCRQQLGPVDGFSVFVEVEPRSEEEKTRRRRRW